MELGDDNVPRPFSWSRLLLESVMFTSWISIIPLSYLAMEGVFIFGTQHIGDQDEFFQDTSFNSSELSWIELLLLLVYFIYIWERQAPPRHILLSISCKVWIPFREHKKLSQWPRPLLYILQLSFWKQNLTPNLPKTRPSEGPIFSSSSRNSTSIEASALGVATSS